MEDAYSAVKADNWNRADFEDFNKVLTNWLTVCRKVVRRNVNIDIIGLICINIQKEVYLGPGSMSLIAKGGQSLKFEQTGSLYKAGQFVQRPNWHIQTVSLTFVSGQTEIEVSLVCINGKDPYVCLSQEVTSLTTTA